MLHAKFQDHRNWVLKKKILKEFYHMWVLGPPWSYDQDHFHNILSFLPQESPNEIWLLLAKRFQRRSLKIMVMYMYIARGRDRQPSEVQFVVYVFFSIQTHRRPNLTSQLNSSRSTKAYHLYKRYRPQAPNAACQFSRSYDFWF